MRPRENFQYVCLLIVDKQNNFLVLTEGDKNSLPTSKTIVSEETAKQAVMLLAAKLGFSEEPKLVQRRSMDFPGGKWAYVHGYYLKVEADSNLGGSLWCPLKSPPKLVGIEHDSAITTEIFNNLRELGETVWTKPMKLKSKPKPDSLRGIGKQVTEGAAPILKRAGELPCWMNRRQYRKRGLKYE